MSARIRRTPLFGQDGHLGTPLVIQVSTILVKYPEHFSLAHAHFQNLESNINRPYGSLHSGRELAAISFTKLVLPN